MKTRPFLFLFALLLIPVAIAGVRPLTLKQLCESSTRITHGVVTGEQTRWEGSVIVTDWTISPIANLKGSGAEPFTVKVPGGTINGVTMHAGEAPRLQVGEEVVLFLKPGVAPCDIYGWFRGKYTVVKNQIREKRGTTSEVFLSSISAELKSQNEHK